MSNSQNTGRPAQQAPLNPERLPQLMGKWSKLLGKDLEKIVITYDADGVSLSVFGKPETAYSGLEDANLADYKAIKMEQNAPSDEERLRAFRNKFELRLNKEFPATGGPQSGSEADIQLFMDKLGFRERRALLMSQKQFEKHYPNGFTQA